MCQSATNQTKELGWLSYLSNICPPPTGQKVGGQKKFLLAPLAKLFPPLSKPWRRPCAPLKLFGKFSLRLSLFAWNFTDLFAIHIHIYLPIFVHLPENFIKWLIFPWIPIVFTVPSFESAYSHTKCKCSLSEMTWFLRHRVCWCPIIVNDR